MDDRSTPPAREPDGFTMSRAKSMAGGLALIVAAVALTVVLHSVGRVLVRFKVGV